MEDEEYYARIAFLKHGTVPSNLHNPLRTSWKQGTQKQYSIDHIQRSHGQETVLLTNCRKNKGSTTAPPRKFVLKRSNLFETLQSIHEPYHIGRDAMLFAIKKLWYWTGIKKDVENYLQNCEHCQKAKPPKHKPPIQPIKVSKPRERAQMDITYLPADSIGGEKYLLIVIDMFTKFIWVKALKNRDAQSVKQFLKDTFSNEYFEIWQSDNGGEFKNHEVNQLIKEVFESVQIHGAPRKPSTQGGIERVNQTIKWKFRVKIKENPNWTSYLNDITLSYNTTFHSSIGCTPWYAEYGKDYVAPSLNGIRFIQFQTQVFFFKYLTSVRIFLIKYPNFT